MADEQASEARQRQNGSVTHAISNMIVSVLNEYTGRGPTQARTYMHDDLITIVLRDTLTKGERSLVDSGEAEHVLQTRRMYQRAMRPAIVAKVEELASRRVIAFGSDNHIDPDLGFESLLLEPLAPGEDGEAVPRRPQD